MLVGAGNDEARYDRDFANGGTAAVTVDLAARTGVTVSAIPILSAMSSGCAAPKTPMSCWVPTATISSAA